MATPFAPSGRLELVIFSCGGEPQRHRLPVVGQVRIGRSRTTNDIVISDASVSANHAVLTVDSRIYIQDLGSLNGTILRKGDKDMDITHTEQAQRLTGEMFVVEPGDRIVLGSVMGMLRKMHLPSNANAGDGGTWPYPPVVRHPATQAVYDEARKVASSSSRACVLLLGETGVGKDVLARAIHAASPRARGAFIPVNCPAIELMFEREMFGHIKGTFTDARVDAKGYLEAADGGTLFLDEIGELQLATQAKLLRMLDDRRVTPLGSTVSRQVNVRVIAATNHSLHDCVARGTFRKDLFYRLRGFELEIPPLRSPPADIVPLAEAFLEDECRAVERPVVPRLSREAISILEGFEFPGNVRDLRNAMMSALAHCSGGVVLPEHLPEEMREYDKTDRMEALPFAVPEQMAEMTVVMPDQVPENASEKERIRWALHQCGGNVTRAAEVLGMSRRKLFYLLKRYPDLPRARPNVVALRANH
ncbi:MAG: sigma 54-interacting transcriptional regulator [Polyangiaceae bacterium]|nr:sigma 54-interacting transcriptional regulator [Polyangiaceae bacterium]